ncbi:hypothetical protein CONPUDRAFT_154676 [Coniophora puteana RWD-64-598 SS2]|uniref:Uncharacterized protein n=1 Tax=Coniophora puteana (strain RWD-64-598) TaxID=741705 RepID=A0A5M3MQ22_CONPW|nr:uncharacterized protein CONPUDRAFT_154676 [Coniophora puteana RWD-64-598 SS2]EIW80661.1 hypothetical protein CONPUDRAFT_154676 [Coniophora puteana RWD-64-598 SS2]
MHRLPGSALLHSDQFPALRFAKLGRQIFILCFQMADFPIVALDSQRIFVHSTLQREPFLFHDVFLQFNTNELSSCGAPVDFEQLDLAS